MSNIFFTSDLHLGHERIINYCNRPFKTHEEMDEKILENFNSRMTNRDQLFLIGDVAWSSFELKSWFPRLKVKQIHLILGNHDGTREVKEYPWTWKGEHFHTTLGGQQVDMFHYPLRSWNAKGRGAFHLYGHCHGNISGYDRSMDVGVDTNNYFPYSWEEIVERLKDIPLFNQTDMDNHNKNRRRKLDELDESCSAVG